MKIRKFKKVDNLQIVIRKMRGEDYISSASIQLGITEKDKIKKPQDLLDIILDLLKKEGVVE